MRLVPLVALARVAPPLGERGRAQPELEPVEELLKVDEAVAGRVERLHRQRELLVAQRVAEVGAQRRELGGVEAAAAVAVEAVEHRARQRVEGAVLGRVAGAAAAAVAAAAEAGRDGLRRVGGRQFGPDAARRRRIHRRAVPRVVLVLGALAAAEAGTVAADGEGDDDERSAEGDRRDHRRVEVGVGVARREGRR